jgi:hypothetical protein
MAKTAPKDKLTKEHFPNHFSKNKKDVKIYSLSGFYRNDVTSTSAT